MYYDILYTVYYIQYTIYYSLFTIYYLLFTIYYMLCYILLPRVAPPVMTWILYRLVFCPYCNRNALRVRRGSFTIWSSPKTLNPKTLNNTPELQRLPSFIWGFDYNFTKYNFKQTLEFQKNILNFTPLARHFFLNNKGFSEIIVGEIIIKFP